MANDKKKKLKSKTPLHRSRINTMGGGSSWDEGASSWEASPGQSVSREYDRKSGKVTETFKKDGKVVLKHTTSIGQMRRKGQKFFSPSLPHPTKTKKKGGKLAHGGKAKKKYGVVGKPTLRKGGKAK